MSMTKFWLNRLEDESGVSGTGKVAEGIIFSNGKVAMSWLTEYTSVAIYDDLQTLQRIHGHNGKTIIQYDMD